MGEGACRVHPCAHGQGTGRLPLGVPAAPSSLQWHQCDALNQLDGMHTLQRDAHHWDMTTLRCAMLTCIVCMHTAPTYPTSPHSCSCPR
jgi:hypothetical protein